MQVVVMAEEADGGDVDVGDGGVDARVLAEGAYGYAVAAVAGGVVDAYVGGEGFDGDAVVAALVGEVCEVDVGGLHRVWRC